MGPRIQYAKTSDGVSIAFYTHGEGMPIVEMVTPTSIQLDWQIPRSESPLVATMSTSEWGVVISQP